jgi:hypothetical protein
MKSFGCCCIVAAGLLLCGCWANPSLVKIQSDPPGARVSYDGQDLGVTPISTVLACPLMSQHVQLELAEQPMREVPLYKRPIRYFVPWYAIVAVGFSRFRPHGGQRPVFLMILRWKWRTGGCEGLPPRWQRKRRLGRLRRNGLRKHNSRRKRTTLPKGPSLAQEFEASQAWDGSRELRFQRRRGQCDMHCG